MRKTFLFIFVLCAQFVFADATLKIENFVENGSEITFDIMMKNDEEVQGIEINIFSGQGVFDDAGDPCICQSGEVPAGCTECYFDNGLDFVPNSNEEGYYQSSSSVGGDAGFNGCYESGECTNSTFATESSCETAGLCNGNGSSSSDSFCYINGIIYSQFTDQISCEDAGLDSSGNVCSGGEDCTALGDWETYSSSNCNESGVCNNLSYTNECDCLQNDSVWTSDGYIWSPADLWIDYSLPYLCNENGYDWYYANQDASGDDYRVSIAPSSCTAPVNCGAFPESPCCATGFQFCRMPGVNSTDPGYSTVYQNYLGLSDILTYDVSGHCSQRDSYCRDLDSGNCSESQGLSCNNNFPESCCNNSANADWSWQSPYRDYETCIENGFTWTAYDTDTDCEAWGGVWVGSEQGTQGNNTYDMGENFIDYDKHISITGVSNPGGGLSQSSNATGTILMFDFGGASIPASDQYERLITVDATITGSVGDIITLGARKVCQDNAQANCIEKFQIADASGAATIADFIPHIWTIGTGAYSADSVEAANDGICSAYAGETIATDSSCSVVCGDNVCSGSENYINCKMDCPEAVDGDGYCNLYEDENAGTSSDCVVFGCGDYYCDEATEGLNVIVNTTGSICNADCLSVCGDDYCNEVGGENFANCGQDCGSFTANDGLCSSESDENYCNSPADCPSGATGTCPDGCYDYLGGEDGSCADYQLTCGDGVYHYNGLTINEIVAGSDNAESYSNCLEDYTETCGDGYYDHVGTTTVGSETDACAEDYPSGGVAGDGICDDSENPGIDPACVVACEALLGGCCGDGFYHHSGNDNSGIENDINCPEDYTPSKSDGVCDGSSGTGTSEPNGNGENIKADAGSCTEAVYITNGWDLCGDGACDVGFGSVAEDNSNCPADCGVVDSEGNVSGVSDSVCARWNQFGADGAALENAYSHSECTYNDTAFDVCGDNICNNGINSEYNWGEVAGVGSAGDCDQDCAAPDGICTYLEDVSTSDWYSYEDCACDDAENCPFGCGDDICQEGYGETASYPSLGTDEFCYADCWSVCVSGDNCCGNGICEGPENFENCAASGSFQLTDGPPWGDFIFTDGSGDCLDPQLNTSKEFPEQYYLSVNYPNPFNPVTNINYSVKNAGNVKIDIYNILGQHVYTLVDGYHAPGALYQVSWNSSTQFNAPISSGVYFYKMVSGAFIREGRMTIVK